ncbi:MAG: aminotransferase class I and II, partial [Chloroflexi bacterium CFX6]|nr:aminotransferase class I and II [Chloroflexi bacterium CFX6]
MLTLPTHVATRYVVPLREGGSLPAVVETEAGGLYVVKLRGAGQGARALAAELIVGLLATHLGLPVPELALIDVDPAFGRTEGDPEIQDLLRASHGLNVGLRFLDGAFNYDPLAGAALVSPALAADIVWLDALVSNVDRTPRNPNLLIWHRGVWLIDHGAALYFHHHWPAVDDATARRPFTHIEDHVLLPLASDLRAADARLAGRLDADVIEAILAAVPDDLVAPGAGGPGAAFDTPAA